MSESEEPAAKKLYIEKRVVEEVDQAAIDAFFAIKEKPLFEPHVAAIILESMKKTLAKKALATSL